MPVIPLHTHSHWSLLNATPSIDELIARAKEEQLPALALTDTNALYGMSRFVKACNAAGIKPITGAGISFAGETSIQLLVQNERGYANLCALISTLQTQIERKAALARGTDLETLAKYADGLIVLTGGLDGPVDAAMKRGGEHAAKETLLNFIDIFGKERTFVSLEILTDEDSAHAKAMDDLAYNMGVQMVATHEVRYITDAEAEKLRVLKAMDALTRVDDVHLSDGLHFPTQEEMARKFAWNKKALTNTELVASMCSFVPTLGEYHFPKLYNDSNSRLRKAAFDGAKKRYGEISEKVRLRIEVELGIIGKAGYADYFLIVSDIVRFAREHDVPVSPRGSATSSVVSYYLGIHDIDPIAYNLYFERFLNLERHDPPDIDLDFSSDRRDEVLAYVYERHGAEKVAMVCTYNTLQPRMAFRETAKAYGIPEKRIGEIARYIPSRFFHEAPEHWRGRKEKKDLIEYAKNEIERRAIEMSKALEGTPHHLGMHPGGIIISPEPLTKYTPLQHATKGLVVTQFDLVGTADAGLIKIDLLGVSSLTVASRCIDILKQNGIDISLNTIPDDDEKTSALISRAETIGIFQIESPGIRLTLREITARTKDDLIIAVCLYRPGPLKGGLKDAFIRRHHGKEESVYLHASLKPILEETHGVILYQEQVLRIAHEVGGFSLGRADALRKAISRHKFSHLIQGMQSEFVQGAAKEHGIDKQTATKIWKLMEAFAGYGFPKAHAAGYGTLAYKIAYLKAHFPSAFMAARLAVPGGYYSPRFYMAEARRLGVSVRGPHVNHSAYLATLKWPNTIYMGLELVRDLTRKTTARIMREQPFRSFDDFLARAKPSHKEAEHLLRAGCLNDLASYGYMNERLTSKWTGAHTAQQEFVFDYAGDDDPRTDLKRVQDERHLMRYAFSHHLLDLLPKPNLPIVRSSEIAKQEQGVPFTMLGIPRAYHRLTVINGKRRIIVDMEDQDGLFQVICAGGEDSENMKLVRKGEPLMIEGRVGKRYSDIFYAHNLYLFHAHHVEKK